VISALGEEEAEVSMGMLRIRARLSDLELPSASGAVQAIQGLKSEVASRKSPAGSSKPDELVESSSRKNRAPGDGGKTAGFHLPASPGIELDLRGKHADDALTELDRFLDSAFLAGLPFVRIIHGKGTGKLREVVREALRNHAYVISFEGGGDKEGGEGVTVAKMAAS
jgi:DNA mismatch repair protein MutS2